MVDFSKYKIKEESKKVPDSQDIKIILGEQKVALAQPEKSMQKSNLTVEKLPEENKSKTEKNVAPHQIDAQIIDQKISGIINERLLNLVKLGLRHELTIENMIQYFKEVKKTKLYELRRYFSDSKGYEINKILQFLYSTGVITKDKDNWYSLKR